MKFFFITTYMLCSFLLTATANTDSSFFSADHPYIKMTGRIDYANPKKPTFWSSGVYITIRFNGSYCVLHINDEQRWGKIQNYIEVKIDDQPSFRMQTNGEENSMILASGLTKGNHTIIVCKNTEAENGYLQLIGITCTNLLKPVKQPERKIEFIGNSITSGMGVDDSQIPCKTNNWYDQHSAYKAYGPLTARQLKAQWQLSSVSGIGLIHSCCNKTIVMPQVFDKINMAGDSIAWNFKNYQPDLVTICLGQNDGIQDSVSFCNAYIGFVNKLRGYYPNANILLLNSPMDGAKLDTVLKKYILAVCRQLTSLGDDKIDSFFFSKNFNAGCGSHPDAEEHEQISAELTGFIKKRMNW